MKKRMFTTVMALAMGISACLGATACSTGGAGGSDDKQTLQIYIGNYGYGYEWLERCAEAFPKLDWVKEKYGEVEVPAPTYNTIKEYAQTMILSGGTANEYDLLFSTASANASVFDTDGSGNPYYEDLTSLLDEEVPGEKVTLKQKMKSDILESEYVVNKMEVGNANASKHLYGMPWVDGLMGLLYNETAIQEALGSDVALPNTTMELVDFSSKLKDSQSSKPKDQQIPVYIFSAPEGYWNDVVFVWWAQYEGIEGYHNYFKGLEAPGTMGQGIFAQKGRLYSLQALESIVHVDKGYTHENVNTLDFKTSQSRFMRRGGFMSPNGDWVENEMRLLAGNSQYKDDKIKYMRVPVVSQIVEKLDLYTESVAFNDLNAEKKEAYDDQLSAIVSAIDANKTYAQAKETIPTLTEKDYNKVYEARYTTSRIGGHNAYIPAYAQAKDLAKDFLRYLATDEAIKTFMTATNGCTTAYEYDTSKLGFALPAMHESKLAMTKTGYRLSPASSFPLQYYGGLRVYTRLQLVIEQAFTSKNPADRWSPDKIWQSDIDYFEDSTNWTSLLTKAGY